MDADGQSNVAAVAGSEINSHLDVPRLIQASTQRRIRILMLHGRAAHESMLKTGLRAAKWTTAFDSVLEFVCLRALHPCIPWTGDGSPYKNYEALDLYPPRDGTFDNGLIFTEPKKTTALEQSIQRVEELLQNDPGGFQAIGGICEGALTAALIASRSPPGIDFYLNICGSPPELLPPSLRETVHIRMPSLHVLGTNDELYTQDQLMRLPACSDDAQVLRHTGGHVVPPITPRMAHTTVQLIERVFGRPFEAIPYAAVLPQTTSQFDVTTQLSLHRCRRGAVVQSNEFSSEDSEVEELLESGPLLEQNYHRSRTRIARADSAGNCEDGGSSSPQPQKVDSLALLFKKGRDMPPVWLVTFNCYAILTVFVVYHHCFFAHGQLFHTALEHSGAPYSSETYKASGWFQTLPIGTMTPFAILAGVSDHREGVQSSQLLLLAGSLWLTYYSQLLPVYMAILRCLPVTWLRALKLHTGSSVRFTDHTWFLLTALIWKGTHFVCAQRLRRPWLAPIIAVTAHFACAATGCGFPFQREPVFNVRFQTHATFYPHVKPPGELASSWVFYTIAPYLLPSRFPLVLPFETILVRRFGTTAGARRSQRYWTACFLLLLLFAHSNSTPNLRGTFFGVPYAYGSCAHGAVLTKQHSTMACSASLHARAEHTPLHPGDMMKDAFICLAVLTMTIGFVACVPRGRVPGLTRIGTSSLFVYLFGKHTGRLPKHANQHFADAQSHLLRSDILCRLYRLPGHVASHVDLLPYTFRCGQSRMPSHMQYVATQLRCI